MASIGSTSPFCGGRIPRCTKKRVRTPKIIADQQGHGLGVHLADYVESSVARKREAASGLWGDLMALKSEQCMTNPD